MKKAMLPPNRMVSTRRMHPSVCACVVKVTLSCSTWLPQPSRHDRCTTNALQKHGPVLLSTPIRWVGCPLSNRLESVGIATPMRPRGRRLACFSWSECPHRTSVKHAVAGHYAVPFKVIHSRSADEKSRSIGRKISAACLGQTAGQRVADMVLHITG